MEDSSLIWEIFVASQWFSLIFFVAINFCYFALCIISFFSLPKIVQSHALLREMPQPHTEYELPISLMVAAYNEEPVIVESIRSLLQIDYPKYEIVVVNDGSKDRTLEVMIEEFDMVPLPLTIRQRLPHKPITEVYRSKTYPILRVINKENGGCKADASNAGYDAAEYPLVSPLDADTILEKDTHKILVQPFLENPNTVAAGGAVRISNGCNVSKGVLVDIGIPGFSKPLVLFQVLEYFRASLFIRVGWAAINALPIISGAIGLFDREAVIEVGGYSQETHAEDLEIILRLHLHYIQNGKPYHIANVPDANCWTEAPEPYKVLRKQRVRWHQGFVECLWFNKKLLFHPKGGVLSWISIPFQIVFEALSPLIEVGGYLSVFFFWYFGIFSYEGALALLIMSLAVGILITFTALLLEEITFRAYPKTKHLLILFAAAFVENIGYRQASTVWRFTALIYWITGYEESRQIARKGSETTPEKTANDNIEVNSQGVASKK
jgi:cellulose synthase/poly-beta-1,6-N-acetylglucosamine synthase-like glycosyltransferase